MGIQTSQITTSSDGDLSLNPDGTGKVVLPDLSGSGEVPMAVDTDGKVKPLDEREFTELSAIDPGDNIMVQRGADYFRIDATNLGGLGLADPNPPTDIEWSPSTPPGSGTQVDPYVLTPATVYTPGGTATSVESCFIKNQKPDSLVLISEVGGQVGARMDQPGQICNNDGQTPFFAFDYVDTPNSTVGQDYDGLMRIGQSSIYVKWVVTQVANNTIFGPVSSPNASPTTVDYAADGKYGTVTGTWADGDQTLTASNMVFGVSGGTMDSSSKSISDGDIIAIGFVDSAVASASEGDTITGSLSGPTYYSEISMVKNTVPAPFTIQPRADQATSAETTTGNEPILGINAPTSLTAAGSSANQLTNTKVSINGATAVTSGTFNPGDSLQGFGTTGASANTTYQATFTVGGVASTWDVSTPDVGATIGQPIITSPANGSADLIPEVILTGSAYDPQDGAGAHSASTWEVYEADAGAAVSPSIATTDGESPLTLSGPAPGGLRDKVVMVDSASPTVIGGETQPSEYTLTTSTITNAVDSGSDKILTFASPNPDLKYFRTEDVVQGSDVKVVSTDLVNNKMTVDGGSWSGSDGSNVGTWNQSQVWSDSLVPKSQTGTWVDGSPATHAFDGNADTCAIAKAPDSEKNNPDYQTWVLTTSISVTDNITLWMERDVYIHITGNLGTHRFYIESDITSAPGAPYVITAEELTSNGVGLNISSIGVKTRVNRVALLYRMFVDGVEFVDQGVAGGPVGETEVAYDITGKGEVAATNGAQVTLTSVEGRWVGSGSENKAGKTFYAATVAQDGAPGAPSDPVDTSKYTAVTPSATTLTSATLDKTNLTEDKFYYSRVKYGDGSIESDFSEYNEFGTADSFVPKLGSEYGGGMFIGQYEDGGLTYNLILSPIEDASTGLKGEAFDLLWKTSATGDDEWANDRPSGRLATETAGGLGDYPIFAWAKNNSNGPNAGTYDTSNSVGTGIGGYNDWYIPSGAELYMWHGYTGPYLDGYRTTGTHHWGAAQRPPNVGDQSGPNGGVVAHMQSGHRGGDPKNQGGNWVRAVRNELA